MTKKVPDDKKTLNDWKIERDYLVGRLVQIIKLKEDPHKADSLEQQIAKDAIGLT